MRFDWVGIFLINIEKKYSDPFQVLVVIIMLLRFFSEILTMISSLFWVLCLRGWSRLGWVAGSSRIWPFFLSNNQLFCLFIAILITTDAGGWLELILTAVWCVRGLGVSMFYVYFKKITGG